MLQGELTQLASLYDGRIIIIDQDFQIIEDTYAAGRRAGSMVAEEVVRCFKGETTSHYVSGRFIEMTVPIIVENKDTKTVIGVILASASTDVIHAQTGGTDSFCTDVDRSSDHLCTGTLDHSCQLAGTPAAAYEPVYRRIW